MPVVQRMPVIFLGHGSPMNAIETNDFTQALNHLGQRLPRPRAILCVSAHWMTEGTWVTHMPKPKTIHDFYGSQDELFAIQYAAPGSPESADLVRQTIKSEVVFLDETRWGFDHGTWSVLRHLYPQADIPVFQMSLNISQAGKYHFNLGRELRALRDQGILIVGSGNIVHNLRQIRWESDAKPLEWAVEFDQWVKIQLLERNFSSLTNEYLSTPAGRLSVPTPDHYYPLLSILGTVCEKDTVSFEYEGIQNGSISMRAVAFDPA